ncbi:hypothetical protein Aperf_G00000116252 [Anoplocephala perfoliata]
MDSKILGKGALFSLNAFNPKWDVNPNVGLSANIAPTFEFGGGGVLGGPIGGLGGVIGGTKAAISNLSTKDAAQRAAYDAYLTKLTMLELLEQSRIKHAKEITMADITEQVKDIPSIKEQKPIATEEPKLKKVQKKKIQFHVQEQSSLDQSGEIGVIIPLEVEYAQEKNSLNKFYMLPNKNSSRKMIPSRLKL